MADYYPLLARALDGLPENNPDARQTVYERARAALLSQLRSLQPSLGEAEVAREIASLDEAIGRAEATWGEPQAAAPEVVAPPERRPPAIRRGGRRGRPLLTAAALLLVVAPLAVAAWYLNTQRRPAEEAAAPPPVVQPAPVASADPKIEDRVSGQPPAPRPAASQLEAPRPAPPPAPVIPAAPIAQSTATPPVSSEPAPATSPPPVQTPSVPPPASPGLQPSAPAAVAQPDLPIANPAILFEENAADPQTPVLSPGRALWRLDTQNPGQGQPLETVVRANVDVPDAGLSLQLTMQLNRDSTMPASHTLQLSFTSAKPGVADRAVRDVGVPVLKGEAAGPGIPLAGLAIPVKDNVFLIGLNSMPVDVERNRELLVGRNVIELPIQFASRQRAMLRFEKGVTGERVLREAFRQWGGSP